MKIWWIAILLTTSACGLALGAAPDPRRMLGQSEATLFQIMGPPTRQYIAHGHKIDAYQGRKQWFDNEQGGPYVSYPDLARGGGVPIAEPHFDCNIAFKITAGTVTSFTRHGSGCRQGEGSPRQLGLSPNY